MGLTAKIVSAPIGNNTLPTDHHLTTHDYRSKFGLPDTYPMVAPGCAKVRPALAKKIGLGSGRRGAAPKKVGTKPG